MKQTSIIDQIRDIELEMKISENRFSMLTDPDLIESEIYEIKCLQAKWRFLLKQAKDKQIAKAQTAETGHKVSSLAIK